MLITLDWLRRRRACAAQIALFRERFGTSVELTPDFDPALAVGFDIGWLADRVLDGAARNAYYAALESARDAYDAALESAFVSARGAHDAARDAAWGAYNAARDAAFVSARDAYDTAVKPARDAYDATVKPARDAYDKARARAFLKIIHNTGE